MYLLVLHILQQVPNPLREFKSSNRVSHGIIHMAPNIGFISFSSPKGKFEKVATEIAIELQEIPVTKIMLIC